MPVDGRGKQKPLGAKALTLCSLALLVGVGCFDLDVPSIPATPPPPSLTVLTPQPLDIVNLTTQVSLVVDSVDGVGTVSVLCGPLDAGLTAFSWSAPPYVAMVDFSVCQSLTTPNDAGPLPLLQLSFQAHSDAGGYQEKDFPVQLNAQSPRLIVQYPPTAQPKSPFTVTVSSDVPLSSFPVVMLAGISATSVTSNGGTTYTAFFKATPGLGTDNFSYHPGVPVPIEVLTDTDEVVRLTVEATARSNGNTTALDLGVELSRVVWDRYIPGVPAQDSPITWAAEPVAFDGGLVLPLSTTPGGGASSPWIPGVLSRGDGTFSGFDNSLLPDGGLDGGYAAKGINLEGATLFLQVTGRNSNLALVPPAPSRGPVLSLSRLGAGMPTPLTTASGAAAVPDVLCEPAFIADCVTALSDLLCFAPDLTPVIVTSPTALLSGPPDAGVAAAGGRYLAPNSGRCGSSWSLFDLVADTVTLGPLGDPNGAARSCAVVALTRVLAVGDGTFVVQLDSSCDATGLEEFPILHVGPSSEILGAYTAPLGTQRLVRREVVGVLADSRVVTLTNNPPNTSFELWSENPQTTDTADVTTPVSGLYDAADATAGLAALVARSVYSSTDGHFAVLLSGAPLGVGVLAFGPSLQPLWFYLYPRVTTTGTTRLVSSPRWSDVYLVDTFNNRAVSLRVTPPP